MTMTMRLTLTVAAANLEGGGDRTDARRVPRIDCDSKTPSGKEVEIKGGGDNGSGMMGAEGEPQIRKRSTPVCAQRLAAPQVFTVYVARVLNNSGQGVHFHIWQCTPRHSGFENYEFQKMIFHWNHYLAAALHPLHPQKGRLARAIQTTLWGPSAPVLQGSKGQGYMSFTCRRRKSHPQ